jgi:CRP/FNR family transcriptional regulator
MMRHSGSTDHAQICRATEREAVRRLALSQSLPPDRWPFPELTVESGILLLESHVASGGTEGDVATLVFPGDVLSAGLVASLPGASLRAIAPSVVRLSAVMPEAARGAATAFAGRLLQQLTMISTLTAEQRLAALLVLLGRQLGRKSGNSVRFDLPMSRSEMAHYLALNPETLSRSMTRFKTRQVLKTTGRRKITVLDWDALCRATPLAACLLAGCPIAAGETDTVDTAPCGPHFG